MRKMKVSFNRWYNAVLTVLLSLLGYSCSSSEEEPDGLVVEYGAPSADYVIKGTVMDETGAPVQGIKTSLKLIYKEETKVYSNGLDSVKTDATGNYQLKHRGELSLQTVKLLVEDIDGEANGGEFLSDTLDIEQNKAVKVKDGDGHWYQGEFEISQDVQLKKKP